MKKTDGGEGNEWRPFGVPKITLQDRLQGNVAQWIVKIAKCGISIRKMDLPETTFWRTLEKHNYSNNKLGQQQNAKRHPEMYLREAEGIIKACEIVTEDSILLWCRDLQMFSAQNKCIDILGDPSRILKGDESGFPPCRKTRKVL